MILEENKLLPYVTSELPDGPWLVFAPHPDDETFGMGGSLLLAREQGIETHIVFVTDGAQGGNGDRDALVKERMAEARTAASLLGVNEIYFFAEPDRKLRIDNALINRTVSLMEQIQPKSVFFPTPMEYHPDHRVTAQLAWHCASLQTKLQIDCFSYEISTLAPINLLLDVTEVAERKYDIVKLYASQLTQAKYLALVKAVDTARTFSLPIDRVAAEGFFHFADRSATLQEQLQTCIPGYFQGVDG